MFEKHPARRLDQLLSIWEDSKRSIEVGNVMMQAVKNRVIETGNWREFREFLFNSGPGAAYEIQLKNFEKDGTHFGAAITNELFLWFHRGRRVYYISNDLLKKLVTMDLSGLDLGDIPWPGHSVFLTFEQVFTTPEGSFDALLGTYIDYDTSFEEEVPWARIRLIDAELEKKLFSNPMRADILRVIERGNVAESNRWWKKTNRRIENVFAPWYIWIDPEHKEKMSELEPDMLFADESNPIGDDARRLLMAFLVYLEQMPQKPEPISPAYYQRPAHKQPEDQRLITSSTELFCIGRENTLGPVRRTGAKTGNVTGREVGYHKRGWYMRRPAGTPPDHPKTIRVPKEGNIIEVRKDKKPKREDGIPGVTVTTVK